MSHVVRLRGKKSVSESQDQQNTQEKQIYPAMLNRTLRNLKHENICMKKQMCICHPQTRKHEKAVKPIRTTNRPSGECT